VQGEELERVLGSALTESQTLFELLRRPDVDYFELLSLMENLEPVSDTAVAQQVAVQAKYSGYIDRQHDEIARHRRHEETVLPDSLDYGNVRGLSKEAEQKLKQHRPATIGQAARISGVTPAAISLLLVHLKKQSA